MPRVASSGLARLAACLAAAVACAAALTAGAGAAPPSDLKRFNGLIGGKPMLVVAFHPL